MWDVLIGEVKIGRLVELRVEGGTTHCAFEPAASFGGYAAAFVPGDISRPDDEELDAIVDEIAVEGVFLVGEDGTRIIDPDLRIDGGDAWFQSSSST